MKRTIILGARADGHAKVVLEILKAGSAYQVIGFADDDPAKKGTAIKGIPVLGGINDLEYYKKTLGVECAIAAIGNNAMRRQLSERIVASGLELINAIHPTVYLDPDVVIGKGCYLGQGVIVVTGTKIGDCVNIHTGATIDHDNIIESGANLGPGVHTAGRVKIGKDAFLGTGAVVIPDASVGEGSIIGSGAVVINHLPARITAVGVPARIIKKLPELSE
ncbi:MAG: acetyltransferase [Bacteroidia bacterium]|jgi:sugar O-acyltransferase (sialic acid O-acetyltransferase NeuD family)|nr:acetyltransferase [Bacteroidia bacterium]